MTSFGWTLGFQKVSFLDVAAVTRTVSLIRPCSLALWVPLLSLVGLCPPRVRQEGRSRGSIFVRHEGSNEGTAKLRKWHEAINNDNRCTVVKECQRLKKSIEIPKIDLHWSTAYNLPLPPVPASAVATSQPHGNHGRYKKGLWYFVNHHVHNVHKPYGLIRLDSQDVFCGSYYCTASQVPRISTRIRRKYVFLWNETTLCANNLAPQSAPRLGSKRLESEEFMNSVIPWSCCGTYYQLSMFLLSALWPPRYRVDISKEHRSKGVACCLRHKLLGGQNVAVKSGDLISLQIIFQDLGCLGHQIWNLAGTETLDTLYPIHIYTLSSFG